MLQLEGYATFGENTVNREDRAIRRVLQLVTIYQRDRTMILLQATNNTKVSFTTFNNKDYSRLLF